MVLLKQRDVEVVDVFVDDGDVLVTVRPQGLLSEAQQCSEYSQDIRSLDRTKEGRKEGSVLFSDALNTV